MSDSKEVEEIMDLETLEDVNTIGVNLRVTAHAHQGSRKYMEDMLAVCYQPTVDEQDLLYAYFGIFDGHGGKEAAAYTKVHLMENIVTQPTFWAEEDSLVLKAIHDGYLATHHAMLRELEGWPKTSSGLPSTSGTTATVTFVRRRKLYIGHVGDSGVILGYQETENGHWHARPLTTEHKPESVEETTRITQSGGKVVRKSGVPRVVWNRPRIGHQGPIRRSTHIEEIPFLAVARSLGDFWSYNSDNNEFVVSPKPDVCVVDIDVATFRCLIFGSDGLWNMLNPQEAVNSVFVAEKNNERQLVSSPAETGKIELKNWINPSKRLVDRALDRWFHHNLRADNTSVITVVIDPPGLPKSQVFDTSFKATDSWHMGRAHFTQYETPPNRSCTAGPYDSYEADEDSCNLPGSSFSGRSKSYGPGVKGEDKNDPSPISLGPLGSAFTCSPTPTFASFKMKPPLTELLPLAADDNSGNTMRSIPRTRRSFIPDQLKSPVVATTLPSNYAYRPVWAHPRNRRHSVVTQGEGNPVSYSPQREATCKPKVIVPVSILKRRLEPHTEEPIGSEAPPLAKRRFSTDTQDRQVPCTSASLTSAQGSAGLQSPEVSSSRPKNITTISTTTSSARTEQKVGTIEPELPGIRMTRQMVLSAQSQPLPENQDKTEKMEEVCPKVIGKRSSRPSVIGPRKSQISPTKSKTGDRKSLITARKPVTTVRKSMNTVRKSLIPAKKSVATARKSINTAKKVTTPGRKSVTAVTKSVKPETKSVTASRKSMPAVKMVSKEENTRRITRNMKLNSPMVLESKAATQQESKPVKSQINGGEKEKETGKSNRKSTVVSKPNRAPEQPGSSRMLRSKSNSTARVTRSKSMAMKNPISWRC